jgi:hypothetical protein
MVSHLQANGQLFIILWHWVFLNKKLNLDNPFREREDNERRKLDKTANLEFNPSSEDKKHMYYSASNPFKKRVISKNMNELDNVAIQWVSEKGLVKIANDSLMTSPDQDDEETKSKSKGNKID